MLTNDQLKRESQRRGWSREYVAEQIGIADPKTIGRWERGVAFPRQKQASSNISSIVLRLIQTVSTVTPLWANREERMGIFDDHQWMNQLREDDTRPGLSRRRFLQHGLTLGLAGGPVASLLTACSQGRSEPGIPTPASVEVLNVWEGEEEEQASFRAVVAPFTDQTGITVSIDSTRDLDAVVSKRLEAHNPPDIVILSNPGKMQQLARKGVLTRLDTFLDMKQIGRDYAASWVDLGSYDGKLYALPYRVTNKGMIWYNPTQFKAINARIPLSWSELITLSESIARSGKYPWSIGVESGATSGWPATDWIAEIYLKQSGPDLYDAWVAHKTPWTDTRVRNAFQWFGQIAGGTHYIADAPQSLLSTGFQQASYTILETPPQAYMYYLGDVTASFLTSRFPDAKPAVDFNFFPFPMIAPQYKDAVTGGADLVVAMRDTSAVRALIRYLATAQAQTIWVKRGGFTSANKSVDLLVYPNPVARASAAMLTATTTFRFGAGDLMPPAVQQAFWKGTLNFIRDQNQLDTILADIESIAQQVYLSPGVNPRTLRDELV